MSEWKESFLEDITVKVTDGSHQSPKADPTGMPMFSVKDMYEYGFDFNKCKRISTKDYNLLVKQGCQPEIGDVLIAKDGSVMKHVFVVKEHLEAVLLSSIAIIRPDKNKINADFLSYFLKNPSTKSDILSNFISGAGVPRIVLKDFKKIKLSFPEELKKQKDTVSYLLNLDQKIENNRKINEILEGMAQAVFKSWFVDFEPTRAKMAALEAGGSEEDAELAAMRAISGKTFAELEQMRSQNPEAYAELKSTATLFPYALQESDLGQTPTGWEVKPLDKIADYQNGLALQKFRPKDENNYLPVLKIAQLKKGSAVGGEKASPDIKPECIVYDGDVVFSWSGSLMVDIWCGGTVALNQHLFKVTSEAFPKWLYYYFTKHHLREFQRIAEAKAVTMGHIKREHLRQALCVIPCNALIEKGNALLGNNLAQQINLRLEALSLTQTRDVLLPKLLSGEIDVGDIADE